MILVDSSVWIAYFNGVASAETDRLDALLGRELIALGDLILVEVLQGFRHERDFETAERLLTSLTIFELTGRNLAVQAARNYRLLRQRGITIRKTIDVIIATFCIEHGIALLHADRDFLPMQQHLGLSTP